MTILAAIFGDPSKPPYKEDLATKEGVLSFCKEVVLPALRSEYEEKGQLDIETYIFASHSPQGTPLDYVTPIIFPITSSASKEFYSQMIRRMVQASKAHGVIFTSESWILRAQGDKAIAEREMNKYPNLGDHPDSEECLFISLEHAGFETPQVWTAFITRDAEGKPTLGPFEMDTFPVGSFEGRFMGLLHTTAPRREPS